MENKKEYCENLYKKYKEINKSEKMKAYNVKTGKGVIVADISLTEMEELSKRKEELKKSLEFLSDNQLIELSGDIDLAEDCDKILTKRRNHLK